MKEKIFLFFKRERVKIAHNENIEPNENKGNKTNKTANPACFLRLISLLKYFNQIKTVNIVRFKFNRII